jgi:hypothetical protein|tara:strand:- start:248 stop:436 length:189 start_codon:yes stop_codon:yes gene_type:complete
MIDCASSGVWGNYGCDGGFIELAFEYTGVYPLMQDRDYPYEVLQQDKCFFDPSLARVQTEEE